ncbi:MAG: AMP-binding protein [Lentisphaeria bacterium]|nr:AMP-binding protein [Lentisphaeria bacterium]
MPDIDLQLKENEDIFIVSEDGTVTYREFAILVAAARYQLNRLGQKRISWVYQNRIDDLVYFWAGLTMGYTVSPLSPRLDPMTTLIQPMELGSTFFPELPDLEYDSLLDAKPEDIWQSKTCIFTSGSSSRPKIAQHSFANHYYSAKGSDHMIRLKLGDCWYMSIGLHHVGGIGILMRTLLNGTALYLSDQKIHQLSFENLPISHLSVVPTMLIQLMDAKVDLSKFKVILIGGAALPNGVRSRLEKLKLNNFMTTYGSTEMSSQVTTGSNLASSGELLPYRQLKIHQDGEILLRGETLFDGYFSNGEFYSARDEQGWFHTGDLGELKQGELFVKGRKDNLIISGGENIQLEELEALLSVVPGVVKVICVGIDDEKWGQRPIAFLKTSLSSEELSKVCRERMPQFKVPDQFLVWPEELEQNPKVSRVQLIELFQTGSCHKC